ncbi:MAG: hypothetical protein OJF47_001746 [Nitrospira sp.]|nr:MAG: hypothetical protein OJF47_001746 [Nitrospira sp.]
MQSERRSIGARIGTARNHLRDWVIERSAVGLALCLNRQTDDS